MSYATKSIQKKQRNTSLDRQYADKRKKKKKRDTSLDSQYATKKRTIKKRANPLDDPRIKSALKKPSKKKVNPLDDPRIKSAFKKRTNTKPNMKAVSNKVKVTKGMTLSQIAKANNTTIQALKKANNIDNVNMIRIGQSIKVPKGIVQSKNPYKKTKPKKNFKVTKTGILPA
tara:strand:+ start:343 stop:858 length:516 start_codon:yes stop_codon:yes gene_type:complete